MNRFSGASVSYWNKSVEIPHRHTLSGHSKVDVVVIGAGISGLSSAYLLLKAGKSVVVLDQGVVAGGDTGRTSAHLSNILDDGLAETIKKLGAKNARLAVESHAAAIDQIERIVIDENIDCDFKRVSGYLFCTPDTKSRQDLLDDYDAAKTLDLEVSKEARVPFNEDVPALKFSGQAQFHVTKYLLALAEKIESLGGKIHEYTRVTDIKQGSPAQVSTKSGIKLEADFVIEAGNSLVTGSVRTITKLYPYRTFAIGFEVPRGSIENALYWDNQDPYHYVRIQPDSEQNDLLIVGGEDHKTGQANDASARYERLESWARSRWPQAGELRYRWSGQVLETPDGLALIGVNPGNKENSFLISGDSGHGLTHGTLGAMILRDRILGIANPYTTLYEPSRFHSSDLKDWIQENVNVGAQYLDWLSPGDVKTVDQIQAGEGAILRQGLRKVAVHKDLAGKIHACSAVCTHLGGLVKWNSEEKTWDCPCHGSRFNANGKVVANPAIDDLAPARLAKKPRVRPAPASNVH